jgi:hypothetical protein
MIEGKFQLVQHQLASIAAACIIVVQQLRRAVSCAANKTNFESQLFISRFNRRPCAIFTLSQSLLQVEHAGNYILSIN